MPSIYSFVSVFIHVMFISYLLCVLSAANTQRAGQTKSLPSWSLHFNVMQTDKLGDAWSCLSAVERQGQVKLGETEQDILFYTGWSGKVSLRR